jgi:NTE family protein
LLQPVAIAHGARDKKPSVFAVGRVKDDWPGRMTQTTAFLRNVPVLAGLSDELLEPLGERLVERRVPAGAWILREGESADSLYIVRSGKAEVIHEGPPETLVRTLRRGDVVGELALLQRGVRSASARARRDVELLELGRADFENLIEAAPSFALGLTRAMGAQLAASHTPAPASTPPQTIAVVGLNAGAPIDEVADELGRHLAEHGRLAQLREGDLATIDQAERDADRVVMRAGSAPDDPWTALCLREADLVLAVSTGAPDMSWLRCADSLDGCELLVLGGSVAETTIEALAPRQVQVVVQAAGRPDALAAMARRLAGRSVGIVLSGGGARALAHLGVLEELLAAGVRFDRIAGVSLGSLVAAGFASGMTPETAYEAAERGLLVSNPSNDYVLPVYSLVRGVKSRRMLSELFGRRRIEELPLRFFCVSCDLIGREAVVHRIGPVADAVYSSLAIPGVFPPVSANGHLLVDGGVLDNLPVATMARSGEGPVIAVDVTGRVGQFKSVQRRALGRLRPSLRRTLTGSEAEIPRLTETIVRTVMVGSADTVINAHVHADLVITPRVEGVALMDWKALPRVRELGRRAAQEALSADPELLGRLTR